MRSSVLGRFAPVVSITVLCLLLGQIILNDKIRAQQAGAASVTELIESLKMTEEQQAAFQEQETLRKESQARLKQMKGEERRVAGEAFQEKRKAALQELFTEEQWKRWGRYWTTYWSRQDSEPETKEPQPAIPLDAPEFNKTMGRFQVAKMNGRATLVTPEGKPFFSLGVTHIVAIGAPTGGEPNVLADRFNGDWSEMAAKTNENLRAWGYNSTGYGTPRPLGKLIPYTEGVHTAETSMYFGNKQFSYPDVFDSGWQEKVKQTLQRKIEPHKDNPNLMGIYWTDMPLWDLNYGKRSGKTNWVEAMKALPEEAPGRQRYEEFLAEQGDQATDEEFLRLIARTYYKVIGEETRRLAPDSIIFGERYGPNITPSSVIEEAAPWTDAVAVQPYGNKFNVADFDRIHRASGGKGIIICDHNISFPTKEHPKTMWTQLPTVEKVAQTHAKYVNDALSKPYILGYHRCQYIDRFQAHLSVLKQGLIQADGSPYEELVQLLTKTNEEVQERFAAAMTPEEVPAQEESFIRLKKIDGRHWLVGPNGKPFFAHGITHISNKQANLDYDKMSAACKELGFNAYGYGCPPELRDDMPYVESWNHLAPISYYRGKNNIEFFDIFDPEEQVRLEAGVKFNCQRSRKNPNVIGYCWTDLGSWPLENPSGINWVEFVRSLPENSAGQKKYQEFLKTWNGEGEKNRDWAFLRLIAREYFRVIGEAQEKYDPDHLVFGDRFAFNTISPMVLEEMLPYVDGIAIQPPFQGGFPQQKFDEIYEKTGKPILICDYAVRFKDGDKDIRSWKPEADSVAAGKTYAEYVKAALATDYIVGVFWCNPVDTSKGFGNPGVKQGFFGEGLSERPGLHQAVKELNAHRDGVTPEVP